MVSKYVTEVEYLVPPTVFRELMDGDLGSLDASAPARGYAIPRRSSFCGRFMRPSGWWPDYVVRLFRREHGRFTDDHTPEPLAVAGPAHGLREPILHPGIPRPATTREVRSGRKRHKPGRSR